MGFLDAILWFGLPGSSMMDARITHRSTKDTLDWGTSYRSKDN